MISRNARGSMEPWLSDLTCYSTAGVAPDCRQNLGCEPRAPDQARPFRRVAPTAECGRVTPAAERGGIRFSGATVRDTRAGPNLDLILARGNLCWK